MEELSQLPKMCLCIASRTPTVSLECKIVDVPTLSTDAARGAFYCVYKKRELSTLINSILEQLDFRPLFITLLGTVSQQNRWSMDRLGKVWDMRRTTVLRTGRDRSLAAAIEPS